MKNFYPDDNDFRDKMLNHEFEFMPQAWEQMQQKLQPPTARQRRVLGWWGSIGLCSMLGLALGAYMWVHSDLQAPHEQPQGSEKSLFMPASYQKPAQKSQPAAYPQPLADNQPSRSQISPVSVSKDKKSAQKSKSNQLGKPTADNSQLIPTNQPKENPNGLNINKIDPSSPQPLAEGCQMETALFATLYPQGVGQPVMEEVAHFEVKKRKKANKLQPELWLGVNINEPRPKAFAAGITAGVGLSYQLAKKHHLELGLQYKQLNTTDGFALSPSSSDYLMLDAPNNAALYDKSQVYSLQRVDLLELRAAYKLYLAPKHSLKAGAKLGLVANLDCMDENLQQPAHLSRKEANLQRFAAAATVGYEWDFSEHWSASLQGNIGLNNLASSTQRSYLPFNSYAGAETREGELFLLMNAAAPKNTILKMPTQLYNSDLQLAVKYTF